MPPRAAVAPCPRLPPPPPVPQGFRRVWLGVSSDMALRQINTSVHLLNACPKLRMYVGMYACMHGCMYVMHVLYILDVLYVRMYVLYILDVL